MTTTNKLHKGILLETQIVNGIEFLKVENYYSDSLAYFTKTGEAIASFFDPYYNFISTKIVLVKNNEDTNEEEQELFFVTDLSKNRLTRDDLRSMKVKELTSVTDYTINGTKLVSETKLITENKTYDVLNYYNDFVIFIGNTPYIFTIEDVNFVIKTK